MLLSFEETVRVDQISGHRCHVNVSAPSQSAESQAVESAVVAVEG